MKLERMKFESSVWSWWSLLFQFYSIGPCIIVLNFRDKFRSSFKFSNCSETFQLRKKLSNFARFFLTSLGSFQLQTFQLKPFQLLVFLIARSNYTYPDSYDACDIHVVCMLRILKSVKAGNTNTWFNTTESNVIEEIQQIDDSNQGKCSIM